MLVRARLNTTSFGATGNLSGAINSHRRLDLIFRVSMHFSSFFRPVVGYPKFPFGNTLSVSEEQS